MPSDVTRDVTPQEVTPVAGKGALGTWQALKRHSSDSEPRKLVTAVMCRADG